MIDGTRSAEVKVLTTLNVTTNKTTKEVRLVLNRFIKAPHETTGRLVGYETSLLLTDVVKLIDDLGAALEIMKS